MQFQNKFWREWYLHIYSYDWIIFSPAFGTFVIHFCSQLKFCVQLPSHNQLTISSTETVNSVIGPFFSFGAQMELSPHICWLGSTEKKQVWVRMGWGAPYEIPPSHVKGVNYPPLSKVYCVTMAAINRRMSSRHINITHTYLGEASIRKTINLGEISN